MIISKSGCSERRGNHSLTSKCRFKQLNPIQYGGGHYGPLQFSLISPERLELRQSNFLTFSFYLLAIRKT